MSAVYYRNEVLSIPETEARKKWVRENTSFFAMKLNNNTDADIIEKLESVPNRQGYVKAVIRQDIAQNDKEE